MNSPLLTVVITTKNRKETLFYSVKTVLDIDWDDMELIIQDCSDNDEAEELIKSSYSDSRLKYCRSPKGVSMTENWNLAMENVSGKYLTIIGDDDGVLPTIKDITIWANDNNIELVSESNTPRYYWPNFPVNSKKSTFFRNNIATGAIVSLDTEESLKTVSYDRGSSDWTLPRVYYGITKFSILERIKKKTGAFFLTYNPDFYSAYSILIYSKEHYKINFSFAVAGGSASSNSASYSKDKIDIPHFNEYKEYKWPSIFPDTKLVYVTCRESRYKAFQENNREELNENLDLIKLYSVTTSRQLASFFKHWLKLQTALKLKGMNLVIGNAKFFYSLTKRIFYRLLSDKTGTSFWALRRRNKNGQKLQAENIDEACKKYQKKINEEAFIEFKKSTEKFATQPNL